MEGSQFPVRWYRHTREDSMNEELKDLNTQVRNFNIIAFGDSMVKFLPILGALSVAISGARYKDLERMTVTGRDFLGRRQPDVMIIMAGTNDVNECIIDIEDHITNFFANMEATFPHCLKIVLGVRIIPKYRSWTLKIENAQTKNRKEINEVIQKCTRKFKNYVFRNPYKTETIMVGSGRDRYREINRIMYSDDGLHLSKKGKEQLAINIIKTIIIELRNQIEARMNINIKEEIRWYLMSRTYNVKLLQGRIYFKGSESLLSNFRTIEMTIFNKTFSTSEAAYQYSKAMFAGKEGIALAIMKTKTGSSAKDLADKNICPSLQWHRIMETVMEHITTIRILNDHDLRRFLINNKEFLFVEDTGNEYWARGREYRGQNKLGKIMNKLGQIANCEHALKANLETTARRIDEQPQGFFQKLIEYGVNE